MADSVRASAATAVAAVLTVAEFRERFGEDAACHEHLKSDRGGENLERFECPACGCGRGWWLSRRQLVECRICRHQTSVTAGTVFHRLRSPLWKWFWAMCQLAQDRKGIAALALAKQVGVCYRANRRTLEPQLFDRRLRAALDGKAPTYRELVAGASQIFRKSKRLGASLSRG